MAESKSPEDVNTKMNQLKEWIHSQSHLPKDIEDRLLIRFIHSCYYDMEKTKKTVDLFFTIRTSIPDLLNNRDPLSQQVQKTLNILNLAHIKISGNRNLWIWQLNDPGLEKFDYVSDVRLFFMTTDAWLLDEKHLEEADIVLMDVKDITLKFLTKFNVSIAKKLSKYQEDAFPIRLKQIHVVNAPPFIDKIFSLMKPFLNKEITQMVHFHTPKSDTLYQYISKDDLPEDYGGQLENMEIQMKKVVSQIMSQREHLLNDNLWRALDKKSKKKGENSSEVESFRSLDID